MAANTVNTGTIANDGTGDTLRTAFTKINGDVTELYSNVANLWVNVSSFIAAVNVYEGVIYTQVGQSNDSSNAALRMSGYATNTANAALAMANTVNSAWLAANGAYIAANNANGYSKNVANALFYTTNGAFAQINSLGSVVNTINSLVLGAIANGGGSFDKANATFILAGEAYDMANAGVTFALSAIANAAGAFNFANGVSTNTTSAYRVVNSAYTVANSVYVQSNSIYYMANISYLTTNAAYNCANTKVNTINGIVTGLFTAQGNVYVYGSSVFNSGLHTLDSTGATITRNINIKGNPSNLSSIYLYDNTGGVPQSEWASTPTYSQIGTVNNAPFNFITNNKTVGSFDASGNFSVSGSQTIAGSLNVTGDIVGLLSDERLKKDVKVITDALEKVNQLKGVTYHFNDVANRYGFSNRDEQIGLIAQDVEKVIPQVIRPAPFDTARDDEGTYSITGENYKTVLYDKVVPLLVEAIKELSNKIDKLEEK